MHFCTRFGVACPYVLCIVHVTHVPMVMQSRMVAKGTKAPNGEEAYARHDDAHQDRGECVHSRDRNNFV